MQGHPDESEPRPRSTTIPLTAILSLRGERRRRAVVGAKEAIEDDMLCFLIPSPLEGEGKGEGSSAQNLPYASTQE